MSPDVLAIWLNGKPVEPAQARISVFDRGFLFGDGVYEVIPAYGGRLFRVNEHLERLQRSLAAIRMANPLSDEQWKATLEELVDRHPDIDQQVYLQITRGPAPKRDHAIPEHSNPTVFCMSSRMPAPPEELAQTGISAITLEDVRWRWCHVKAITLLANVLMRQAAKDRDAMEAILIRDGRATEGAASNLFIVSDGVLTTPPKSEFLLPGITRDLVLELAAQADMPTSEADIELAQLRSAQEVWLTSSSREVMPVTLLDDAPVGSGQAGPMWHKMRELFQDYKRRLRAGLCP